MPSSADAGRAWLALAAALALGALLVFALGPGANAVLDWQPSLAWREPWRTLSAVFVHYSALHLLANLAGAGLVAALGWLARVPWPIVAAWALAWPLTQLGLLARPDLLHYGGLSGVLHAGVACVGCQLATHARGMRRTIGALVLIGLALKVVSETPWGAALRHRDGWDIATAPFAHTSGFVAGVLAAIVCDAIAQARRRRGGGQRATVSDLQRRFRMTDRSAPMRERKSRLDWIAVASLIVCCFLWGLNQVAAKAALPEVGALWQAALRSSGATVLLFVWSRSRRIALFDHDRTLVGGLVAGTLFAAEFFCIFVGLQFTTASRMVVFIYIAPFVVALGMPLIARSERLDLGQGAGLVLAFAGVAWAFAEGFSQPAAGAQQWLGDALGVLAGVLWGATTLAIRASALNHASAEKTLLYQLALSALLLLGAASIGGPPPPLLALSLLAWSSLAFQIVVVSFASYLLWFWLIRHYAATRLASFTMLTPVFGLVLGALLLAEPITSRLLIALAAVAAGILLVNRKA